MWGGEKTSKLNKGILYPKDQMFTGTTRPQTDGSCACGRRRATLHGFALEKRKEGASLRLNE